MTQLSIINEQDVLGKNFRIYGDTQNPLFLASDVAQWIEHSNSRMMLTSVDEEEKICVNNPYALKGQQQQWFLTENGLYEVLMLSRKPIAKEFKKQVKTILKAIRKTGGYVNNVDLMVNTYFGGVDDTSKQLVKGLLQNIDAQQHKIIKLESTVKEITTHNLTLESFNSIFNRYIRHIAKVKFSNNFPLAYNEFYDFLNYKIKINIRSRKTHRVNQLSQQYTDKGKTVPKTLKNKVTLCDVVKPEEYDKVLEIVKCWAVDLGVDITNLDKLQ